MIGQVLRLTGRGLADLARHPVAQFFTLAAVAMVSALAGALLLALVNVDRELARSGGQVQVQAYWRVGSNQTQVRAQWEEISRMPGVTGLATFTPDQALDALSNALGEGGDFSWLRGSNPLPPTAELRLTAPAGQGEAEWVKGLVSRLLALPGVERVRLNPLQTETVRTWIAVSRRVLWPVIGVLGLVVALVVGNTVRLSMLDRRDEVEILRLVGARPWYIRLPLLAGGAAQGLVGGGLALVLLKLAQSGVREALNFPPLFISIVFLPAGHGLGMVLAVGLVGAAGSWMALRTGSAADQSF